MEFRKHFDYDVEEASNSAVVRNDLPSLTVQSMAEDADINEMMDRFGITGKMPENVRIPTFGDFSGVTDFASAMDSIIEAQDSFMELPAKVRSQFDNDPQKFLEFCSDQDKNGDEMERLGLFNKDKLEARAKARAQVLEAAAARAAADAARAKP